MQIRIARYSPSRDRAWTDANLGRVFDVTEKRHGGYDVDLAPLGYPGELGFYWESEVDEIPDAFEHEVVADSDNPGSISHLECRSPGCEGKILRYDHWVQWNERVKQFLANHKTSVIKVEKRGR